MAHYTGQSIVDFLNSTGQDSSFSKRAKLAVQYGIVSSAGQYTGSADQNTRLLGTLRGQHNAPSISPTRIFGTPTTTPITMMPQAAPRPVITTPQPTPFRPVPAPAPVTTTATPAPTQVQAPSQEQRFPDGTVFKFPDQNRYHIKKGNDLIVSFVSP